MADVKVYGNIMTHTHVFWKSLPFQIYRFCWWRCCTLPWKFNSGSIDRDCSMTCGIGMQKLEFKPIFFSPEIVYLWQKTIRECNHFTMGFLWWWAPSKKTSIFPHHPIFFVFGDVFYIMTYIYTLYIIIQTNQSQTRTNLHVSAPSWGVKNWCECMT